MKNINKQGIKRPWKTPSPSLQDNLKSPRFARTFQNRNAIPTKTLKQSQNKQEFGKHRNMIKHFRSELMNLKQEANKMITSEQKKKTNQISAKNHRYLLKTESTQNDPSMTPFNSYYHGSCKQQLIQKQTDYEDDKMMYPNSYRQCLRKCAAQNAKLKKQLKEVKERQKILLGQKEQWRLVSNKKERTKSILESELFQQLNLLKKMLDTSQQQLNNSNLQIYRIKQQLCENQIQKQKLHKKIEKLELNMKVHEQKLRACESCSKMKTQIHELIGQLDNQIFETSQKGNIISGLCSEIKCLELELKGYEKPKQQHKKLINTINDLNEDLIKSRIQNLNKMYIIQN